MLKFSISALVAIIAMLTSSFYPVSKALAQPAAWSMKDVEVALSNKNFIELQANILSIAPASRTTIWAEALRETILYQLERTEPGANILVNLDTLELLKPYLAGDLLSYDFRVEVAKFLRLHTQRHANALEWFRYAADKDASRLPNLCMDNDLKLAVLDGLLLNPKDHLVADSIYFAERCYQQLAADIKQLLAESGDEGFANICPLLKKNNALQGSIVELRCKEVSENRT